MPQEGKLMTMNRQKAVSTAKPTAKPPTKRGRKARIKDGEMEDNVKGRPADNKEMTHVDNRELEIWPGQVRTYIDPVKLAELADSMHENGQLNPLHTFEDEDGKIWLIAGQRRLLAKRLEISQGRAEEGALMKVIHLGRMSGQQAHLISLIENLQREDMMPSETAKAIGEMRKIHHLSNNEIAKKMAISGGMVRRYIALSTLDESSLADVDGGKLNLAQAEVLAQAPGSMRNTVRNWIESGRTLEEILRAIHQKAGKLDLKHALFSEEAYLEQAPEGIEENLFQRVATSRTAFMKLQEETLKQQLEDGVHGQASETVTFLQAELPSDAGLVQDDDGEVLIGLISPMTGEVKVMRAARTSASQAELVDNSGPREEALRRLRSKLAKEAVQNGTVPEGFILTLLVQQIAGGDKAFALGRAGIGEDLGIADPALGLRGETYKESTGAKLQELLRSYYEGGPDADRAVLLEIGLSEVLATDVAPEMTTRDILILVPGIPTGVRNDVLNSIEGLKISLEPAIHLTAAEAFRQATKRLTSAGISGPNAQLISDLAEQAERGEANERHLVQAWRMYREQLEPRMGQTGHEHGSILSADELLAIYERHEADTSEDAVNFREAVNQDDYVTASKLAARLAGGAA